MVSMFPTGQFTLKQGNPDATLIFCTDDEYLEKLLRLDMTDRLSKYSCSFEKLGIITVIFIDFYSKGAILTGVYL